jgi:hypothetical protein
MAFNLSPRGGNFSKTGHGLPGGMIKSMPPLHQSKKVIDNVFRNTKPETSFFGSVINAALNPIDTAVALGSTISDYVSGNTQSKPKPKVKTEKPTINSSGETVPTIPASESWKRLSQASENKAQRVYPSDAEGNFKIDRGLGFTPPNATTFEETKLTENVKAYKGTVAGLKNIQQSKDADVQAAINKKIDYWQNPEVQRMYLNNHPEYKGDLKKAQQDINTHLALGANYEYVPSGGFSTQNKKQIGVNSGAAANTFFSGYNQTYVDAQGKVAPEGKYEDNTTRNLRDLRSKRGIVAYEPFKKGDDRDQLRAEIGHEMIAHSAGFGERQKNALGKILGDPSEQPGDDKRGTDSSITSEGKTYLSRGDEMYGKFTEYKDLIHLTPGQKVNRAQLEALEKKYLKPSLGTFESLFDIDRKVKAINEVAQGGKKKSNLNFSGSSDKEGFKFTGNSNSSYA